MYSQEISLQPSLANQVSQEIMSRSGQPLTLCYQCSRCASGCPVSELCEQNTPDRLIRSILFGLKEEALNSPLISYCVSCYTCGTRCPNSIHTSRIIEALKQMAEEEKHPSTTSKNSNFHHSFIRSSLFWGRANEMALMSSYEFKNIIAWAKEKRWPEIQTEIGQQARLFQSLIKLKRLHFGWLSSKGRKELKRLAKHNRLKKGL